MRRRAILIASAILLACVGVWSVGRIWPHRYFLKNAGNRSEREALCVKIEEELKFWKANPEAAADADRLYPLERLPVVLQIQKYYLDHGELPKSLEVLDLQKNDRARSWLLTVANGRWNLKQGRILIAKGN